MTLKTKNIILSSTIAICAVIFIMQVVILSIFPSVRLTSHLTLLSISFTVLISSILIHIYYKKSLPSEIIFYAIFLVSISIQSIRIFPQLLKFDTFTLKIIISRGSIFFKYIGLLSLLGASLFSFTIKKQKIGTWLLTSILGSFILSSIIHFNTGITQSSLLLRVIFRTEELVITSSIIIISVGSFFKNSFDGKNREFFYMGLATLALSLSLLLSFISLTIITGAIIIVLLIVGSLMYLRSMHNITLWG